jgi:phage-related protein
MRTITLDCVIVADSFDDRRDAVEAVADWLDTDTQDQLWLSDRPDRYWVAKLGEPPDVDEWRLKSQFKLPFVCEPYAYAVATSSHTASATGGGLWSQTWTVPDGVAAWPVVEVTPLDGDLDGFTFTLNGVSLTYAGTVTSGTTITISSISAVLYEGQNADVELTGALEYDGIDMADVDGDFGQIEPGSNTIGFLADGATTATLIEIDVSWRRRYRQ